MATDKFYTTEACSTNGLQSIFKDCTRNLPNLGVIMNTDGENFDSFKDDNQLDNLIPFLVERKFCYYDADSKDDRNSLSQNESLYNLFDANNILIEKEYATEYQPDDIVKNNIVNNFSNNIFDNSVSLYQSLISKLMKSQYNESDTLLTDYYNDDIINLKKDIVNLNNDKLKHETHYSSKYYELNRYETNTNILINSIFIVAFIFVIGVLDNNGIVSYGFVINGILLVCLVIYLMLSTSTIRDRQYSNWDKRYFDYVNDISDKV
tara:strand:- start:1037 stop:1828 length:792 start_codon:yes stop_codon:yes gene_type:complete